MAISNELYKIADKLTQYESIEIPALEKLEITISSIAKSFSGSWLGKVKSRQRSRVYGNRECMAGTGMMKMTHPSSFPSKRLTASRKYLQVA